MQHTRMPGRAVDVPIAGNLLTVLFDTLANLLLVGVAFVLLFVAAGDVLAAGLDRLIDPSGEASTSAYHVRAILVAVAGVGSVALAYFGTGWRRFHSSLGLRMMRVFSVLPARPKFPAVKDRREYLLRYALPTVVLVGAVAGLFIVFG